jgi:uncharacterized membrane protein YgcG
VVALARTSLAPQRDARASGDTGWTITSFRSDIIIENDGLLSITETIDVDFFNLEKHGIFREIPVEYDYDGEQNRIYEMDVISVTDAEGDDWPYERSRNGANVQLKIGDPDETISGKQTYVITYELEGVLNAFPDHDELYWNVNGPDWPVPTEGVVATVSSEGGGINQVACFQGFTGADDECTSTSTQTGDAALFASEGSFNPGEQMTIVVGIEKGVVSPEPAPILVDKPENFFERNIQPGALIIAAAIALLIVEIIAFVAIWWRHGRDRTYRSIYYLSHNPEQHTRPLFYKDQVVVEYTPPDDLRPAQLGLILDERADTKDVTATIIDLAVRGYLTIEEKEKSWIFGSKDWRLTKKKNADSALLPFETQVLSGLFEDGDAADLSDLKNKFYEDLAEAQKDLYSDAMNRKWFARDPEASRGWTRGAGIAIIAAGVGLGWLLGTAWGAAIVGVPVVMLGVFVFLAGSGLMSQRTATGSEALRRALGFRLFIETAEKRRQEFNEKANIFAEYLPYAIVFGSVDKWANAFRDIDTEPATRGWYTGAHAFAPMAFSRDLESFSSSVSSVIASTPGSSGGSGFGGGGFSGGGGGGGGGGSW